MSPIKLEHLLTGHRRNILVVDDSRTIRQLLRKILEKSGFNVVEAEHGVDALEILAIEDIPTIICDWEMPVMNGLDFCRSVRSLFGGDNYYILMLTANTERGAVGEIFEAGGDDYLTKPLDTVELFARLKGALRITAWSDDLKWLNAELNAKKKELDLTYAKIQEDLVVAESVQRRYLPPETQLIDGIQFAGYFEPAFHTAGDIYNYLKLSEHEIGFFSVDVSGHGVASSLVAISVAETICVGGKPQEILLSNSNENPIARDPSEVVCDLNDKFSDKDTDHYFTFLYGVLNTQTQHLRFCQAGHPPLCVVNKNGDGKCVGGGGLPVGMFPALDYETTEISLNDADRVFTFSDGIPEAENNDDQQFSEELMLESFRRSASNSMEISIKTLVDAARQWGGENNFDDDVSILGFELSA